MREIKFRAWDSERQEMVYFQELFGKNIGGIHWDNSKGILHPMQFTGLLDKNGKEIYEGDIVSKGPEEYHGNYVIVWNPKELAWGMQSDGGISKMSFWIDNTHKQLEVVGNIHENPDLISPEK